MSNFNYSFELHELSEALTSYGTIETRAPEQISLDIQSFDAGTHFRTKPEEDTKALVLSLDNRLLTLIVDSSGSMTWNDFNGDRFTYLKRLLTKLDATYPGSINSNLITFGGTLTKTNLFITQAGAGFLTAEGKSFNAFLQETFQDSVYDFAGVRIVRRSDRYPEHPADGVVVAEGIFEAAKDDGLIEGQEYFYGVWTFNKNLHFSNGQFVSGKPFDRSLPRGVNAVTALPRILPGVARDEFTQLIYNFVEGSGLITFDSSGNGRHGVLGSEVVEENFWLGDAASDSHEGGGRLKKPVGIRFDGTFDIIETSINDDIAFILDTGVVGLGGGDITEQSVTINFWLFRYNQEDNTGDIWLLGTSTAELSNSVGWVIGLTSTGTIAFQFDTVDNGLTDTGIHIPEKEWSMITVVFSEDAEINVFVNGELEYTSTLLVNTDTSGMDTLYVGAKPTSSAVTWSGTDYFGSFAQLSISNTNRNSQYISSLYDTELKIFNQPTQESTDKPPDNTQREVLLSWDIGKDFNYANGTITIVRKYLEAPSHINDGDIIVSRSAEEGRFFFLDVFDFINNSEYYYRIFTVNASGLSCDRLEARILPVYIPASINSDAIPALSTVTNETATNGNKKVLIEWSNPTSDDRWIGTQLYYGDLRFPTVSIASQGTLQVSDGSLIADTTNTFFVHRDKGSNNFGQPTPLNNAEFHYYTLITYDRLGRISSPKFVVGIPSINSEAIFTPDEVSDLHIDVVNPETLSLQWINPTLRTDKLDLYFGETALIFVSVKDVFGGNLTEITNLKLQVCTSFIKRGLTTSETELGSNINGDGFNPCEGPGRHTVVNGGCEKGSNFEEDCNTEQEIAETILVYATVESGLIKGLLTHTNDKFILSRRQRYDMSVRAQYKVADQETGQTLFEFNTESVSVSFKHPVQISLINKLKKMVTILCGKEDTIGGDPACPGEFDCGFGNDPVRCRTQSFNGSYVNATQPYICRAELQFKGEALPDGTPVNVQLFKHGDENPLSIKSTRTNIREGTYQTLSVLEEALDPDGNPTGETVSKSIVDIEIPSPILPDNVDLYVSLDYLGFLVDAIHEIRFISNLFIQIEATGPFPDGIDVSEQFATVWTSHPDFPDDQEQKLPVPDGTVVKWELLKLRFAKERPFYSTESILERLSGIYSSTVSGVARHVFFGPVGNIDNHKVSICQGSDECCIGEEYAIKASVILGDDAAVDAQYVVFRCKEEKEFANKRFLMNAADNQPGYNPNWITWANGESLLKFEIAKNPAISQIRGASCFRDCVESQVGGQLFAFPEQHIVQITADAEILWNVTFSEDPYTGTQTPIEFQIALPIHDENKSMPATANIPINGDVTDFYLRINRFVGEDKNPKPEECDQKTGPGGGGGIGNVLSPCEWENICSGSDSCFPVSGKRWANVSTVSGQSTLLINNIPITLGGGGGYEKGIPPILFGFKEPLDVNIVEARVNGARVSELVIDNISSHTFVIEVSFAGCPVPNGTPVEIKIEGPNASVVRLSDCRLKQDCFPASSGTIFTRIINDPLINPSSENDIAGPCSTFNKKSLAYFTIDPLPNIAFRAKILITCRYDKLGTVERVITKCIEVNNTVNISEPGSKPKTPGRDPIVTTVSSNEMIIYDTVQDLYEKTRAGQVMRMSAFAASVAKGTADFIYVFGGFSEKNINAKIGITATGEIFNTTSQEWVFTTDMPTPRTGGMTVVKEETIFCIGGLEMDQITQQYRVSRKIEAFDTETELWNTSLAPLPENLGVAFGDAQYINNYIYVTCGINTVINNTSPGILNSKILRYSVDNDEWEIITPSDELLYKRISPFAFYRNPNNPTTYQYQTSQVNDLDEGEINTLTGNWNTSKDVLTIGSNRSSYIRFPVDIPSGSVIINASLSVIIEKPIAGATHVYITLMDVTDARTAWTDIDDPTDVSNTAIRVEWNNIAETNGDRTNTPDITSLIQSFIQRPDYVPGNYIGINFVDNGSDSNGRRDILILSGTIDGDEPILSFNYTLDNAYYVYGGSIPKPQSQIDSEYVNQLNKKLNEFRAKILTSSYYQSLKPADQKSFIEEQENKIAEEIIIPPFIYPATGFRFRVLAETQSGDDLIADISDTLEDDWPVLPMTRDRGSTIYLPQQDTVYFMGGSNQNKSTTLNRVESIDLSTNTYTKLTPFSRGRALFGAVAVSDEIYLIGGLTSGHAEGYVEIELETIPDLVQARGTESAGILVTLRNDSGEVIDDNITCIITGRLRLEELDSVLIEFLATRGADRVLGGDGSGNAPDQTGGVDLNDLIKAQNKITDPNSDQFQFNSARKLTEQVFLFPILYSEREFVISNGIAGVTLHPRSEDPLTDFTKLSQFIKQRLDNTPIDPDERFQGDLTREELIALGDALNTVSLPPTVINAGTFRELYQIETIVTIVDSFYFGQTVSDFDFEIQDKINSRIEEILTKDRCEGIECPEGHSCNPENGQCEEGEQSGGGKIQGSPIRESKCFVLQHLGDPEIPTPDTPPPDNPNSDGPGGTGGFAQSGQCLFCDSLIPLKPNTKPQLPTQLVIYWNSTDWVPQIHKRLVEGTHSLSEAINTLDIIDHETPFGSSQLYNSIIEAARATSGETFNDIKKVIYITSDNSQNLSLSSRDDAIDEVNSVDGEKSTPVIYTVFSTSFPLSISSQLERTEVGDVEKITQATGGQSSTLISSNFLDQILNLTLGNATGGMGYGIYSRKIVFDEITAFTAMTFDFSLPTNTQGFVRFRYSVDGYNFTDFTERFEGSRVVDFVDLFAKILEIEVTLTTGFTSDITEEYDLISTGIPKLNSISFEISNERNDFVFLNPEIVLTNAQQVAAAFEGSVPSNAIVEIGVGSSLSHDWRDFQSNARPALNEFGKTLLLDRTDTPTSVVPSEPLNTIDGLLYTSNYGAWDPSSTVTITKTEVDGTDEIIKTGFNLFPRDGEIYFDNRQSAEDAFTITITNANLMRIGLRFRNRLHSNSIVMHGVGYIYNTNDVKPAELSQVAPRALNVFVSPQSPTAADTILALYDYMDLNNDAEIGSLIYWYKNGLQLFEIQNKTSWTNTDLNQNNKLVPNDKLNFAVTPSDGQSFGVTVFSPVVTVTPQPPGVDSVTIVPIRSGIINDRFDTSSVFFAKYTFINKDTGKESIETNTVIRWFVNGVLFKEGTFSSIDEDPYASAKELTPLDIFLGGTAHSIGNQIFVEIVPKTLLITGDAVKSSTIIVVNSIPIISDVKILPVQPTRLSTLSLSYSIDDDDIDKNIQTDQSEIRWFNSINGVDFLEIRDLRGKKDISPSSLRPGQSWYAEVQGYDGLDLSFAVKSNIVVIQA